MFASDQARGEAVRSCGLLGTPPMSIVSLFRKQAFDCTERKHRRVAPYKIADQCFNKDDE